MYINKLIVDSFRTFRQAEVEFLHPDQDFTALEFPRPPRLPNVNLLLGNNGSGKTTLLKAIARPPSARPSPTPAFSRTDWCVGSRRRSR